MEGQVDKAPHVEGRHERRKYAHTIEEDGRQPRVGRVEGRVEDLVLGHEPREGRDP